MQLKKFLGSLTVLSAHRKIEQLPSIRSLSGSIFTILQAERKF